MVGYGPEAAGLAIRVGEEPNRTAHVALAAATGTVDAFHAAAWPPAGRTTARPGSASTTTTYYAPSSAIRTATTSRRVNWNRPACRSTR